MSGIVKQVRVSDTHSVFPPEVKVRVIKSVVNSKADTDCVGLRSASTPEAPAFIALYGEGGYKSEYQEVDVEIPGGGLHVNFNAAKTDSVILTVELS